MVVTDKCIRDLQSQILKVLDCWLAKAEELVKQKIGQETKRSASREIKDLMWQKAGNIN